MPKKKKNNNNKKPYKKQTIPKAVREQVWITTFGECFKHKCYVSWCQNYINVFDFHVGHDVPESHGGSLDIKNIKPICARCNLSMSDNYTIKQWDLLSDKKKQKKICFSCF